MRGRGTRAMLIRLRIMVAACLSAALVVSASEVSAAFCPGPGYQASQVLDATRNVLLEWSVCGGGIDVQLSADTTGWLGLAWGPVAPGPLDAVQGKVEAGVPTVQDSFFTGFFGWVHTLPIADSDQDLSDTGGSETLLATSIHFSRLLDTGDTLQDFPLSVGPGVPTTFYWGISPGDDFLARDQNNFPLVSGQGYADVYLSRGVVPEPGTLLLLGAGLAALAGVRRRSRS